MSEHNENEVDKNHDDNSGGNDKKRHKITIHIDRHQFKVDEQAMTGEQLRQLPSPPIGHDYDLFLEVPGGEDELIGDEQEVQLRNGMHFFSVQRNINPGR